ncbi:DnaJ-like protein subfamily A member 1 [Plecturocebus cupreus]
MKERSLNRFLKLMKFSVMQRKRKLYNKGGEKAIKEGGAGGGLDVPMDIFDICFGGGKEGCREKGEKTYGATTKLALQKNLICEKCKGRGGKKGAVECCSNC